MDKKITFCATNSDMLDVWPHPTPASRNIPEEYKKLERFNNNNMHVPTLKTCMPFLDSEERFEIIPGIVDTDVYVNLINFPFILRKRDEQFLIKKGEPMVQVIPFKRESWKMWSGFYKEYKHAKTRNKLLSKWVDKYKTMFWNKKSFK